MAQYNPVQITKSGTTLCVQSPAGVGRGGVLTFQNDLLDEVQIFIPNKELLKDPAKQITIVGPTRPATVEISSTAPIRPDGHVYAVVCVAMNDFGIGCSHPKIIINQG